jgi:hypothetical protein
MMMAGAVMFNSWRLQLKEAQEAFRAGRMDEAVALVRQGDLHRYLPGKKLSVLIAQRLVQRAGQRLQSGESAEGWRDLEIADQLGAQSEEVLALRRDIVGRMLADAEQRLAGGETVEVIKRLESIERHTGGNDLLRTLLEVARRVESARNLRMHGKHADALMQLERAATLRPDLPCLQNQQERCQREAGEVEDWTERLHAAMSRSDWTETLALAGKLLQRCPHSTLATDARRRAWLAVGSPEGGARPLDATMTWYADRDFEVDERSDHGATHPSVSQRFLLWVDGVGGYLVCLDDQIVLGQSSPGNRIAVPIQGDLSRQHARIRREDGYLIEPLGEVWVGGRKIQRTTVLTDGDEIRLGSSVCLRFHQPHPLSSTARLERVSQHRMQPAVDAILLMAESCVLGPKHQNHVVCRDWSNDVVLFRRDDRFYCRAKEGVEVDGRFCDDQTPVQWDSHVVGGDFSFSLEPVS